MAELGLYYGRFLLKLVVGMMGPMCDDLHQRFPHVCDLSLDLLLHDDVDINLMCERATLE